MRTVKWITFNKDDKNTHPRVEKPYVVRLKGKYMNYVDFVRYNKRKNSWESNGQVFNNVLSYVEKDQKVYTEHLFED